MPEGLLALAALTVIETVLGIDNVVFIAVLIARLPESSRLMARRLGLLLALGLRILMLFGVTTLLALSVPVFTGFGLSLSWRDIILIGGGVFLVVKATHEMFVASEGGEHLAEVPGTPTGLAGAIAQIAVINLVFSVDSTITAVGMSRNFTIMAIAICISMAVMYFAAGWVSAFINRHPAAKMLALAFLLLIGVVLIAEGAHNPFDQRILYASMAFSCAVAWMAMRGARYRRRAFKTRRKQLRRLQRAATEASGAVGAVDDTRK